MIEAIPVSDIRVVVAVLLSLVLLYWTYERIRNQAADPVIRSSMRSDTGTASVLISGHKAVMMLAGGVAALLLWPTAPVVADPRPVLLGLGALVVAHWIFEKEEREEA